MGKVRDSIISGTSGRTGRVVIANVNGYEISRIRPKKTSKPPSPKQMLIKDRFNKSVIFMQSYKEYAKQFFGVKVGLRSTYNSAMSNIMKALECDMDNLQIIPHYNQISFSKGNGLDPYPTAISSPNPLSLQIDWENNGTGTVSEEDFLVVLLAEDQELNSNTLFFQTTTTRLDQTHQITLLPRYGNKEMHVWIAFLEQNNAFASNSIYIGQIVITQ